MRRAVGAVVVGVLVLAACTDDTDGATTDDTTSSGRTAASAEAEYADALAGSIATAQRTGNEAFESVDLALDRGDTAAALADAPDAVTAAVAALDDAIEDIEGLDPPADYEQDHEGTLDLLDELRTGLIAASDAAEASDVDAFLRRLDDTDLVIESGLPNLSPSIAGRIAVATSVLDEVPDLTDDEIAYLSGMNAATLEFAARNAEFGRAVTQAYTDSTALLDALVEAGAGTAFTAVRDRAEPFEPPARFAADDAVYGAYLDEAVALDGAVLEAAERGDLPAFVLANEQLGAAASRAWLEVSRPMRLTVFPLFDDELSDPAADNGARALHEQMILLAGPFGGEEFPRYEPFPVATPDERIAAIAAVAPIRLGWLEDVRAGLTALDEDGAAGDLSAVIAYVDELVAGHQTLIEDAEADDATGVEASLDNLVTVWCDAALELSTGLGAAVAVHLGPAARDARCSP